MSLNFSLISEIQSTNKVEQNKRFIKGNKEVNLLQIGKRLRDHPEQGWGKGRICEKI